MRLIDADVAKRWMEQNESYIDTEILEAIPTVDAVPVVYCKDCKYADTERRNATEKRYCKEILVCRNANMCGDEPLAMWPTDFCSYGEKKDDVDHASG